MAASWQTILDEKVVMVLNRHQNSQEETTLRVQKLSIWIQWHMAQC